MPRKPQISVNVRDDVREWARDFEIQQHCSNTQIGLAGLLLLAATRESELRMVISLAKYVDRNLLSWKEVLEFAEQPGARRSAFFLELSEKAVQRHHDGERAAEEVESAAKKTSNTRPRDKEK